MEKLALANLASAMARLIADSEGNLAIQAEEDIAGNIEDNIVPLLEAD
jgi:hypothetical protein